MDLELNEDQRLLRDSVARLLAERHGAEARQRHGAETRALWADFAALGLLGLPFGEAMGGSGLGAVETMLVMQEFGRAMVLEPYLASVVVAGTLLALTGQKAAIERLIAGSSIPVLAHAEDKARHDLAHVASTARWQDGRWVLDGRKIVVSHGADADLLIVSARSSGAVGEEDGVSLFLLPADTPGLLRQAYVTVDGAPAANLVLEGIRLPDSQRIGPAGGAMTLIRQAAARAIAALCAEAVGAMEQMQALTVEYLKTRQQFGRAIGSNQALQHRAVEMQVALEQARSMALFAAMMAEAAPAERDRAMSAAKLQIHRSMRFLGQQAIQLHGGIGITEEYAIGHLFRRAAVIEQSFGDTPYHLARLVEAGGLAPV